MEAYLVMKNNLKRSFKKKSTYLFMILIPIFIGIAGILTNYISEENISVGILNNPNSKIKIEELSKINNIKCSEVNEETKNTDVRMGKYDFVLDYSNEDEMRVLIDKIIEVSENKNILSENNISEIERYVAMLMTVYLIIATIYAANLNKDVANGTVERFCLAGKKKINYLCGYILSTGIIVLIQVSIAFIFLRIVDKNFDLNIVKIILLTFVIMIVSTLYAIVSSLILKKEMRTNIVASSLAMLLSILSGTFIAVDNMPQLLQVLSYLSPIRWVLLIVS